MAPAGPRSQAGSSDAKSQLSEESAPSNGALRLAPRHPDFPIHATIQRMSPELIGILSAAVALAGLIVTVGGMVLSSLRALRGKMGTIRSELGGEIHELTTSVGALDSRMGALEQRMARLEGVLEGAGLFRPPLAVGETVPSAGR